MSKKTSTEETVFHQQFQDSLREKKHKILGRDSYRHANKELTTNKTKD
jgi:hypothetical protein